MNYAQHYERLIERARNRTLSCYVERHHVFPRCLGGSDEKTNLVSLTPEEHYVAHQLLVKMYPGNFKILNAAVLMTGEPCSTFPRRNNKLYGWLRRRMSEARSGVKRGPHSLEHREKIAAAHRGKIHTTEHREANSRWHRGRTLTPEHREAISAGQMGKNHKKHKPHRYPQKKPMTNSHRESLRRAWARRKERFGIVGL